tara:strand:+ start:253 stop:846 length:594 start_codon:yes stop_codon:yes gene_type:complete
MKSKEWLNRQKNDYYVIKAKQKGYFSRSAFKLLEIEQKYNVIVNSNSIFEFGASPGGWSQIILEINPNVKITAIDLIQLKINHKNITFYKDDFLKFDYDKLLKKYDLILSDIAPNTTGHKSTDHLRISNLVLNIINLLDKILINHGSFITKIWKGSEEKEIFKLLNERFKKVKYFKPSSSRKDSSEIYIIAQNYLTK